MSGRENLELDQGADIAPDDFLADLVVDRSKRLSGAESTQDDGPLCRLVRGVRDGRCPRLRSVFAGIARVIPAFVLDWLVGEFYDGDIGVARFSPASGPSDTGVVGVERRGELDEEIGWRVMAAGLPMVMLGALILYVAGVFAYAASRPSHLDSSRSNPTISPLPRVIETSSRHVAMTNSDTAANTGW